MSSNSQRAAVLAIDGGNSKTDVALVDADGRLLAHVRGPTTSPDALGIPAAVAALETLVAEAAHRAEVDDDRPYADVASVYLAGVDLPREVEAIGNVLTAQNWAPTLVVDNDTFALLRAGTDEPNAVVVVCGAGINCTGVAADGRHVRFMALGEISGDWGGGQQLGTEALWHAARAYDGRGPTTVLSDVIPEHFGRADIAAVIEDLHFGTLSHTDLGQLAPKVLAAASVAGDEVATGIVGRQAHEVVTFAATALRRLDRLNEPTVVVLGGGVLTSGDELLHSLIRAGLRESAPLAYVRVTEVPPLVGAILLGFDRLGRAHDVEARLRTTLAAGIPSS